MEVGREQARMAAMINNRPSIGAAFDIFPNRTLQVLDTSIASDVSGAGSQDSRT